MGYLITWYEDWMRDQVIKMFVEQYRVNEQQFSVLFERFYFHPFQKNKALLIAAVEDKKVCGFQSFFFWPYITSGNALNTYQSGNSLVHSDHRGKGLFQAMLAFAQNEGKTSGIDLLMGFPVEASYRNFIKDGWKNPFDLIWYVKKCNPFGFLGIMRENNRLSKGTTEGFRNEQPQLKLESGMKFLAWRNDFQLTGNYYSFTYAKGNDKIIFHLKLNKRKKILNELIIGNVLFSSSSAHSLLIEALRALHRNSFLTFSVHFISIAVNELCKMNICKALEQTGFRRTEKKIHFVVKPIRSGEEIADAANWEVYRADIDTW